MKPSEKPIEELIKELTLSEQQAVKSFIETIIQTKRPPKFKYLRQQWAGTLSDFNNEYTSIELQKKALEWRQE